MHVVHVIARLNDGGPARAIAALGGALTARGHRIGVLTGACPPSEPDLTEAVRAEGLAVERLPTMAPGLDPVREVAALGALIARLRALRPDVVHTHTAKAGALGRLAARALRLPCLHTYHGHVLRGYFTPAGSAVARLAERVLAGRAWHQALTASQLRDLRDRARIGREHRWRALAPPVPPVAPRAAAWHARLAPGLPVVGFLGRLAPVKDVLLWLDALAELARRTPVQGVVCGDGQQRAAAEARAATLGVPVVFTGFVPAAEALGACRLLLMTSRNEGLPFAAIEAAGAGIPVVAPPVGGLADLARSGAVLPATRTPAALAAACARVLGDPTLRSRLETRGRAAAAAVSPTALAPLYEQLYAAILERS